MKRQWLALMLGTSVFLGGCVVTSLHPYYTSKDTAYDPSLVGHWTNVQDAKETWTFEKLAEDSYKLSYFSGGADDKTNTARGYLFKLNDARFLDFVALDQNCDMMPPPIPSHFLLRVYQVTPTLRMAPINNDWLRALLEKDPRLVRHELIGEKDDRRVVFTAETTELQDFLRKHLGTEDAWKDSFDLKRVP